MLVSINFAGTQQNETSLEILRSMSLVLSRHTYFVEGSVGGKKCQLHQIGLRSKANNILHVKRHPSLDHSCSPDGDDMD